ncbi:MAG: putative Serine protease do-like precursor [Deltaproteobacteria bacterium]|nr:putative Serine protease do-like precursor [Deltaproteobacteria bacterium]
MKRNRIAIPLVLAVAVLSFWVGMMVSSGSRIDTDMPALTKEALAQNSADPARDSQVFVSLAEKLMPATVNISTSTAPKRKMQQYHNFQGDERLREFFGDDFFERFFDQMPQGDTPSKSLGSGFIIDKEGYIITNNHVIEGADEIKVKLSDKEEFEATIVGKDKKTDIALIKIAPPPGLPVVTLGDSDSLKVGEWVMAIGNPFGLDQTVTVGIVSAKWRKLGMGPYEDFIQTDAAINQGNSGGPLFNTRGEVVGVNTAIFSTSGGNIGIGFATPINLAKSVVKQLKEKGRVVRGWLGVIVQTVTPDLAKSFGLDQKEGALVADIDAAGPAAAAGIRKGDIIVAFNGNPIKEMDQLPLLVAQTPVGSKGELTIIRDGKKISKAVEIGELKDEEGIAQADEGGSDDIGMELSDITDALARRYDIEEAEGVLVTFVEPASPAAQAGVRPGDVITQVNRKDILNLEDYNKCLSDARKQKKDKILLLIARGETSQFVVIDLE